MPLFVVKHQHPAEGCPAGDPQVGPMLAQHVSSANAEKFGLNLHGEAVVRGAHTLYLILDGADRQDVDRFMQPFTQFGTVEVLEASSCEEVVKRAAC
ncbi:MAG TPA: DUF3303 family protein [Actinomycetota bacterium]|nr:DUF3303 family protein [Actinomycetota bacterium]